MNIFEELLTINEWSRPGNKRRTMKAIVMHWVANPGQSAMGVRNYFESRKNGKLGYGSAHYIIDTTGKIVQCIPDDEIAYHCGSSEYTEYAKELFGSQATSTSSPNFDTIGIEMCHPDKTGRFTKGTFNSAIQLVSTLCNKYNLDPGYQITTHKNVVGWKDCPKYWVDHPSELQRFIYGVYNYLG